MSTQLENLQRLEIAGRVHFTAGQGDLLKAVIVTPFSTAEIYLHGAHITAFKKNGEPPLLYLSPNSPFAPNKAIRGGVPICYPWFGNREGDVAHGFARTTEWELTSTNAAPNGTVTLRFRLPEVAARSDWKYLRTEFTVIIGETLTMELASYNDSADQTMELENCLHTYFHVGDINEVFIIGLQGTRFLDNAAGGNGECKIEDDPALRITKETNRIYLNTINVVEIHDTKYRRIIAVEKFNSTSTVLWNPWTTQPLPDMKPAEHTDFVCVESCNIRHSKLTLAPGQNTALKVVLSSQALVNS